MYGPILCKGYFISFIIFSHVYLICVCVRLIFVSVYLSLIMSGMKSGNILFFEKKLTGKMIGMMNFINKMH